jgi:uncharacterized protein YdhG (YjbR/CyaY superfamily)
MASQSVGEYIATHPAPVRRVLRRVRSVIRKTLPRAEETISYQIPAYKLGGRIVIYFAGWKAHYSLYPSTARVVAALKDALAPYGVSKGTIRFPIGEPVPEKIIEAIVRLRADEVAARQKALAAKKRRR